jgi:hypothetical protein
MTGIGYNFQSNIWPLSSPFVMMNTTVLPPETWTAILQHLRASGGMSALVPCTVVSQWFNVSIRCGCPQSTPADSVNVALGSRRPRALE